MIRAIIIVGLIYAIAGGFLLHWERESNSPKYNISPEPSTPAEAYYIPEPYYTPAPQQYGADVLREYLRGREWERVYESNVFDCSEMSALLECSLENEGFHTYIMVGQYDNGWHSWVKVEIVPEEYVIVEATTLTVITGAEYNKYHETYQYETIYDALKVSQSSFDWWN